MQLPEQCHIMTMLLHDPQFEQSATIKYSFPRSKCFN